MNASHPASAASRQRTAVLAAASICTCAGCSALHALAGSWDAPAAGPRAHVTVVEPQHGGGDLYFCGIDGWRSVDSGDTEIPAGQSFKLKAHADADPHLHHGVEHAERECNEFLQFRPVAGASYRIQWNVAVAGCALVVLRKPDALGPAATARTAEEWLAEGTITGSDGYCAGKLN